MTEEETSRFCTRWLAAWSGNRPHELAEFYAEHAWYRDPAQPDGLRGRAAIRSYFEKLLAMNPDWKWEAEEILPIQNGFVLKWAAMIPVGKRIVLETGLDIVELDEDGYITRNEVYFDRLGWMKAVGKELRS